MPELPEVEAVRRELEPVMVGVRITKVDVNRPDLRAPFPRGFARRITGATTLSLARRAKYLVASLSSGDSLLMHLGMSGSFRVPNESDGGDTHDHVVFHLASGDDVVFNDPRRFGFMDLVRTSRLDRHPSLRGLGPEPLSAEFDAAALARACAGKRTSLKAALHIAGLSPLRRASTIATPAGAPREAAVRLAAAIKQVLEEAIERQSSAPYRTDRFRVYDRARERCRRPRCAGVIRRRTQAGRSSFYCPVCQS